MPPKIHTIYFQDNISEFILIKKKLNLISHLHFSSLIEKTHNYEPYSFTVYILNVSKTSHKEKNLSENVYAMVHKSGPNMRLNDLHSGKEKTITFGNDAKTDGEKE